MNRPIPILMYHSIAHTAAPHFRRFVVPPDLFARQIAYLQHRNFRVLTVSQFVAQQRTLAPDARVVVLTFDDGFTDFYTQAFPILNRYGVTATVYVTTHFVGMTSRWLAREGESMRPLLTWAQLAELARGGIEIGAHSHRHVALDTASPAMAQTEIALPKNILEQRLGRAVSSFAYPFGYYNRTIRDLIRVAGYTSACAVKYTASSTTADSFALARLFVGPDTTMPRFATLVENPRPQWFLRTRSVLWHTLRALGAPTHALDRKEYSI